MTDKRCTSIYAALVLLCFACAPASDGDIELEESIAGTLALSVAASNLVQRTINNDDMFLVSFYQNETTGTQTVSKQTIFNTTQVWNSISVYLGSHGAYNGDYLAVKVWTSCGYPNTPLYWGGKSLVFSQVSTPGWVTVPLNINVPLGETVIVEVSTLYTPIAFNRDRYTGGRRIKPIHVTGNYNAWALMPFQKVVGGATSYPKKEDLVFRIDGTVLRGTSMPTVTSNRACPAQCESVYGTENSPNGSPANAFNILVLEAHRTEPSTNVDPGSFWNDDINVLKNNIRTNLIEGGVDPNAFSNIEPFKSKILANEVNWYIGRENPSTDPDYLRGFLRCANIDAIVDVKRGTFVGAAAALGGLQVSVGDVATGAQHGVLAHEMGHAFGAIDDQRACHASNPADSCFAGANIQYTPGAASLGNGLNSACADQTSSHWCNSSLSIYQLWDLMYQWGYSDIDLGCFDISSQGQCVDPSMNCFWVGTGIAYYDQFSCIPKSVTQINIGQGCAPQTGCFLGQRTIYNTPSALNVAQSPTATMQDEHSFGWSGSIYGYGGPTYILQQIMDCAFPSSCTNYDATTCAALQDMWNGGSPNANNYPFLGYSMACNGSVWRRR